MKEFFSLYSGVFGIFKKYWNIYGGWKDLLRSPYLHFAIVLSVFTYGFWSKPEWWDQVISVTPNLLGFTLGGFAIFLGFGDEDFKAILADESDSPGEPSLFASLCATFVHFILIQILAITYAFVAKSTWFYYPWPEPVQEIIPILNIIGGGIGYGMFLYAITSMLAATMHMFRIALWYEKYQQAISKEKSDSNVVHQQVVYEQIIHQNILNHNKEGK